MRCDDGRVVGGRRRYSRVVFYCCFIIFFPLRFFLHFFFFSFSNLGSWKGNLNLVTALVAAVTAGALPIAFFTASPSRRGPFVSHVSLSLSSLICGVQPHTRCPREARPPAVHSHRTTLFGRSYARRSILLGLVVASL